jgi:hypothetical protein
MAWLSRDPFLPATNDILSRLAEHGAQPTRVIEGWCAPHDVDATEWLEWATSADLVERIYGDSDDDSKARWVIAPDQLAKYGR